MRVRVKHLALLVCVLLFTRTTQAKYEGGTGAPTDPYLIYTPEQMNAIGAEPNDWNKHFKLMADIDLTDFRDSSFSLIGNNSRAFNGVFDGNGHTIKNFTYVITGTEDQDDEAVIESIGFFRSVNEPYAIIKDLGFIDPNLHPAPTCSKRVRSVGVLVGVLGDGLITNCYVQRGSVRADSVIGGLAGINSGVLSECYAMCVVKPAEPHVSGRREIVGGIVGRNYGEIIDCYATGDVSGEIYVGGLAGRCYKPGAISYSWASGNVSGDQQVGGLLGGNKGSLVHCYATGEITGQMRVGGLAGSSGGRITKCYATGNVFAGNQYGGGLLGSNSGVLSECCAIRSVVESNIVGGGLVGFNSGTIQRCYSLSQVSGVNRIGGLVGENRKGVEELGGMPMFYNGIIENSYAQSRVSGSYMVGGLIGRIEGGMVSNCYAAGEVSGSNRVGGFVGFVGENDPFQIEQCFWDITASHQVRSAGGMGLDTESMQDVNTFLMAGWDFTGETTNGLSDFWTMDVATDTYPLLAWDVEPGAFLVCEFNENPRWITQGQWEFGKPKGLGGAEHGYPDPDAGYTGNNVYGVNLSGDYDTTDTHPYYLIAGPFDCSQYSWVKLRFARWLNTDEANYVKTFIEVSTNEAGWQRIWEYDDFHHPLEENCWKVVEYDIGSIANYQPTIYIRWGYQVLNDAWPFSGWNIDDVTLRGFQ